MSIQIQGTRFLYEIDKEDFPDGFIASGTESYVFKGRKVSVDENDRADLSFSCVLKFKPKTALRLARFKEQELKIFEELQECRSVARVYDVIEDIGDAFELRVPGTNVFIRNSASAGNTKVIPCFCVVEEFIDGWSLEQYCRRQFWGLEIFRDGGWVSYSDFTDVEKAAVMKRYKDEKTFFRYQDTLLRFMQSLCGILMFISTTSRKKVLHLDIKPENIMVTRQSEELVLIDFGRSAFLEDGKTFVSHSLRPVDYSQPETINTLYSHGTVGYAAPECFAEAKDGSAFPFSQEGYEPGRMSIESDIFSFGATFWESLNIVELVTKDPVFERSPHEFYETRLLHDDAYFDRDLSLENSGPLGGRYHLSIQKIISKCTRKRRNGYLESNEYYHFYNDLKNDLDEARDSIPTVKKGENKRIRNAAVIFGFSVGCVITFLVLMLVYRMIGYHMATENWNSLISRIDQQSQGNSTYEITQFGKISSLANERMELSKGSRQSEVCQETFDYLCRGNEISAMEASLLAALVGQLNNDAEKLRYADSIMKLADPAELTSVSAIVSGIDVTETNLSYEFAAAINSVENSSSYNYTEAYTLLQEHQDEAEYRSMIRQLAVSLNNKGDRVVEMIAASTGETRSDIRSFLDEQERK